MKYSSFVKVRSLQWQGLHHQEVLIEALKSRGLSQLSLTGLPDHWLRENRDKIKALCSSFGVWGDLDRVLIHLLPVDQGKIGAQLEVAILIACLAVLEPKGLSPGSLELLRKYSLVGAVGLDGKMIDNEFSKQLRAHTHEPCIGPWNFQSIHELWNFIKRGVDDLHQPAYESKLENLPLHTDCSEVEGLEIQKFWLAIAATADVPVILMGPPGSGKSLLAQWAHRLLPPLRTDEHELQQIWALSDLPLEFKVPFVRPHAKSHLSEYVGYARKGIARPGYFALAHGGLMAIDEFAEIPRDCREILRNILDHKTLTSNTRVGAVRWPAKFWLILTSNPCPCGYACAQDHSRCRCTPTLRKNYQQRISGPIYDRLALRLYFSPQAELNSSSNFEMNFSYNHEEVLRARAELNEYQSTSLKSLKELQERFQFNAREFALKQRILNAMLAYTKLPLHVCVPFLEMQLHAERNLFPQQYNFPERN